MPPQQIKILEVTLKYLVQNNNTIIMRKLIYIISIISLISCSSSNITGGLKQKLEIVKIDSIDSYYIFSLKTKDTIIVLGEVDHLRQCMPFKKYLVKNKIKQTMYLSDGGKEIPVKYIGYIDDKRIKNSGIFVNFIDDCESFR